MCTIDVALAVLVSEDAGSPQQWNWNMARGAPALKSHVAPADFSLAEADHTALPNMRGRGYHPALLLEKLR